MEFGGMEARKSAATALEALRAVCEDDAAWSCEMPRGGAESRWRGIPPSQRPLRLRLARGEGSPRQAIKAQCLECMGYDRAAVRDCATQACPLWRFRPYAAGS